MRKTVITIAFSGLAFIGCQVPELSTMGGQSYKLSAESTDDEKIEDLIAPYRTTLGATMSEVLNTSKVVMAKSQPEGLLGNFVADLCLQVGNQYYQPEDGVPADICVLNNGGLRTTLPSGDITRGKVFELMPFENELTVATLSGTALQALMDYIARMGGVPVSNLKMNIKDKKPSSVYIGQKEFDPMRSYKVITSDYLVRGGDNMSFFEDADKIEKVSIKIRDAIIEFAENEKEAGRELTSSLDQRITNGQ